MCVCMCVFVYVYVYAHVYICAFFMHVLLVASLHLGAYAYICACVCPSLGALVCERVRFTRRACVFGKTLVCVHARACACGVCSCVVVHCSACS